MQQHDRATGIGHAEHQHFGHELADLAWREIDHRDHLPADQRLGRVVDGELSLAFSDSERRPEIDL